MDFVRDAFRDDLSLRGGCLPTSARRSMWVPTRRCRRTSSLTADLSEPGWPMHTASEIDIDNFQADLVVSTGWDYRQALQRGRGASHRSKTMGLIVLLVVLILLFGGGGFYYGPP